LHTKSPLQEPESGACVHTNCLLQGANKAELEFIVRLPRLWQIKVCLQKERHYRHVSHTLLLANKTSHKSPPKRFFILTHGACVKGGAGAEE